MAETRANTSLGGYEDEFVDAVDEYWHCAICQLPLKEPILTRCGHRFCKECINAHFERLPFLVYCIHEKTAVYRIPFLVVLSKVLPVLYC